MMNKLLCFIFNHKWLYGLGFSTEKPIRACRRCGKMEASYGG